jgi:hypothetical protein
MKFREIRILRSRRAALYRGCPLSQRKRGWGPRAMEDSPYRVGASLRGLRRVRH